MIDTKAPMPTLGRRMLTPFANLREEMDRVFNDWLAAASFEPLHVFEGASFAPRIDVAEREDALVVTAELPGVEQADIEIELTKTAVILKGQKNVEMEEKGEGYLRRERRHGAFCREIALPWEVDVAKVAADAAFNNGVLTVKVPKPDGMRPASRKIAVHG